MNPDVLKLIAITVGVIISAPLFLASVRAFFFFGKMSQTVEGLQSSVARAESKIDGFTQRMEAVIVDHEGRLTTIEAERRIERRTYGRRATDLPAIGSET